MNALVNQPPSNVTGMFPVVLLALAATLLTSCGEVSNWFDSDDPGASGTQELGAPPSYAVGGTVSGLNGTLVLQNNGGDDLTVTEDGAVSFSTDLADGADYNITVASQPTSQMCSVSAASGIVSGDDVSDVAVVCSTNTYSVSAVVSGLTGTLVLQNNGGDDVTVTEDGTVSFATDLTDGANYSIAVASQPASQMCSVSAASGMVSGNDVTNVAVVCSTNTYSVGGTVVGLLGSITLQLNGADDQTLDADGAFTFATPVADASAYAVTVQGQPAGQSCSVANGSGTIDLAPITDVAINCVSDSYTIGGTITGLNGSATFRMNGADDLLVSTNGAFTFATALAFGSTYAFTEVWKQFANQTCTVTGGDGTVSANVTSIAVACSPHTMPNFAYVSNQSSGDVSQYTIGADGALSPMTVPTVAAGSAPRSLTVDPSGAYAYVPDSGDDVIWQYTIGADGALTPMTPPSVGGFNPLVMAIDPSGAYAYVAPRDGSYLEQYTIGADGALALMTPPTVAVGMQPRSIAIDPSGAYVYVTNLGGQNVSQFAIGANGTLSPMALPTVGAGTLPNAISTVGGP